MTFSKQFYASLNLKLQLKRQMTIQYDPCPSVEKMVCEKIKPINYTKKMLRTSCINNASPGRPRQRAPNISTAQQKVSIFNVTGKARGKPSDGRKQIDYSMPQRLT